MSALYDFTYTPAEDDDMLGALVDAYVSKWALARALGVARPTVYDWLHGAIPRPETYDRIVELYAHLTAWETVA